MSLFPKVRSTGLSILRGIYCSTPCPGIADPIFIIGCGRSGTTILGTVLSRHRSITYLNEPRNLWFSAYPETDIWTANAESRGGKLYLSSADADSRKSRRIRRMFRFETLVTRRRVLIEKLPINSFRLEFIHALFPDARFIHIYRNGLEVAQSIEKANKDGDWFGSGDYKWRKLVDYATTGGNARNVVALCTTDFEKGLLEWRLSTEAAVSFLGNLAEGTCCELSYDEFVSHPMRAVSRILQFIGVRADASIGAFVNGTVSRRSVSMGRSAISERMLAIGGPLLPLSMDGASSLAKRGRQTLVHM